MRVVVATTTPFHLGQLAIGLSARAKLQRYWTYHPKFRLQQLGLPRDVARSAFAALAPISVLALIRLAPQIQRAAVLRALSKMDDYVAKKMEECDVFVGLSSMTIKSAEAAKRRGALVVIDRGGMHVRTQQELIRRPDGAGVLSDEYIAREERSYQVADYIVVPSAAAQKSFLDHGFSRERVVRNMYGVDLQRFTCTQRRRQISNFTVLFVGSWSYQKGSDILAAAVDQMGLNLIHVGTINDVNFPKKSNFRSFGHIPNAELKALYSSADCFVLPSRQDGFGMVLLEALACGLPIVGSDATGAPDILEMTGATNMVQIFKSGSVDGLSRCLRNAMAATQSIAELDAPSREALSWSAYVERYDSFLSSVARR